MKKLVVLIAYVIDSEKGSESGVAWNALKYHALNSKKILLVTQPSQLIKEEKIFGNKISRLDICPRYEKIFDSIPWGIQISYLFWCYRVGKELRKINGNEIELVHHVTFAGDWNPTALIYLDKSLKKVWGPVGGSQKVSLIQFIRLNLDFKIQETIRYLAVKPIRLLVKSRLRRNNTKILAMNQEVRKFFGDAVEVRNFVFREVFFEDHSSIISKYSSLNISEFYFGCGRLISLKNWALAIEALKFTQDKVPLLIAGEGGDLSRLKRIAKKHGVQDRVFFLGKISREDTLSFTKNAKCFVFPSVRDSYSSALAEAVHLGTPIACLGTSGNLSVIRVGKPTFEPRRDLTPREFAALMSDPIRISRLEGFKFEEYALEMDKAIQGF